MQHAATVSRLAAAARLTPEQFRNQFGAIVAEPALR